MARWLEVQPRPDAKQPRSAHGQRHQLVLFGLLPSVVDLNKDRWLESGDGGGFRQVASPLIVCTLFARASILPSHQGKEFRHDDAVGGVPERNA